MIGSIAVAWASIPRPIRKFVVDAIEGGIVAVLALNFALPHNLAEAQSQALLIATTVVGPVIAAARRDLLPALLTWWAGVRTSADN